MEETKQELTMDFPAIEEYLTYIYLDAYKYVLPYAEGEGKKILKRIHRAVLRSRFLQSLGFLMSISTLISAASKYGIKTMWEIGLVRFLSFILIFLAGYGFVAMVNYKPRSRQELRKYFAEIIKKTNPLRSISFTENTIKLTISELNISEEENPPLRTISVSYMACKRIVIHRNMVILEINDEKGKSILLLPQTMAKDKQQWRKIKQFLRSFHKRAAN